MKIWSIVLALLVAAVTIQMFIPAVVRVTEVLEKGLAVERVERGVS